jgi:hypothetical protein
MNSPEKSYPAWSRPARINSPAAVRITRPAANRPGIIFWNLYSDTDLCIRLTGRVPAAASDGKKPAAKEVRIPASIPLTRVAPEIWVRPTVRVKYISDTVATTA